MVQKAVADILSALKTVAAVSVAAALHVDTTKRKVNKFINITHAFFVPQSFFLHADLTVTMTRILRSPNTNVK